MAGEQIEKASSLELETYLGKERALELSDPDKIAENIVREILAAESVDELLTRGQTYEAKDFVGATITVTDVSFNPSALEDGVGVYALIKAERGDTGEAVLITCGARNVMAQLYRAKDRGWLPFTCRLTETERATSRGYRPMSLAPAPKPFEG